MATHEREINEPVDLCLPDGRLNPAARGWSRQPLHRANLRGWGRTKRWDYWCVTTPTHLVALTVSDLDFLALNTVYVLEYGPDGVADEHTVGTPAAFPPTPGSSAPRSFPADAASVSRRRSRARPAPRRGGRSAPPLRRPGQDRDP